MERHGRKSRLTRSLRDRTAPSLLLCFAPAKVEKGACIRRAVGLISLSAAHARGTVTPGRAGAADWMNPARAYSPIRTLTAFGHVGELHGSVLSRRVRTGLWCRCGCWWTGGRWR